MQPKHRLTERRIGGKIEIGMIIAIKQCRATFILPEF